MLIILWGRGKRKFAFNIALKMVIDVYTQYSENKTVSDQTSVILFDWWHVSTESFREVVKHFKP